MNYKKFITKDELKNFCLSDDVNKYIETLKNEISNLIFQSLKETPYPYNHGNDYVTPSEFEARYIQDEIDRYNNLIKYFNGEIEDGYIWLFDDIRQDVSKAVDLSSPTKQHPVFLKYIEGYNLSNEDLNYTYDIWLNYHQNPSLNNLFKYTYHLRLSSIIPDEVKVVKI